MPKKVQKQVIAKKTSYSDDFYYVSGKGFTKTFTEAEIKDIEKKRQEMRKRLFAVG